MCLCVCVGQVLNIGKAHGATIESVTTETVSLHWGLSGSRSHATLKATKAAMEMREVKPTLPGLYEFFQLQVGIDSGHMNTSTLSAANHRFFVVDGHVVFNAMRIVQESKPAKVDCQVLMTQAASSEV